MASKLICIIHVSSDITGDIKQFDNDNWAKVLCADANRRKLFQESKYFKIKLKDRFEDTDGYHVQCYRSFTAVPKVSLDCIEESSPYHQLRSHSNNPSTSHSGILPHVCLFCNKVWKSAGRNRQSEKLGNCENLPATEAIVNAAKALNDSSILSKISGIDLIAKEVKYHHSCRRVYLKRAQRTTDPTISNPKVISHQSAFETLQLHIQQTFIDNDGAELLASLHKRYLEILDIEDSQYTAQSLCIKIMKYFPTLKQAKTQNKVVIHSSQLTPETAICLAGYDKEYVKDTAMYLRTLVLNVKNTQKGLPSPLTVESLTEGEGDTPEELLDFFKTLFSG